MTISSTDPGARYPGRRFPIALIFIPDPFDRSGFAQFATAKQGAQLSSAMSAAQVTIAGGAKWMDVAADRQRHREETLSAIRPPLPEISTDELPRNVTGLPKSVLTEEELAITGSNVEDLVGKISSGRWTSTAVTKAFLRRASLAQRATNCITELLPARALERAAQLDAFLAAHKEPVGPLQYVVPP